tara:strand:- start:1486 stop:1935 length:450 start_codon:yes stop_codon:yes gene_type:complete
MEVSFDFKRKCIILRIGDKEIKEELNIIAINNYTKMASINYHIEDDWKLTVSWGIYAGYEQFLELSEYKISSDPHKDQWTTSEAVAQVTTMAKWRYISKPQAGTIQDTEVHKFIHNYAKFNENNINYVNICVKNTDYGDWNTNNSLNEY